MQLDANFFQKKIPANSVFTGKTGKQVMGIEEENHPATPVKSRKGGAAVIFIPLLYPLSNFDRKMYDMASLY